MRNCHDDGPTVAMYLDSICFGPKVLMDTCTLRVRALRVLGFGGFRIYSFGLWRGLGSFGFRA